jgi:hypothetical protein
LEFRDHHRRIKGCATGDKVLVFGFVQDEERAGLFIGLT